MAGIKDLLSLFYWINNQKELFMDASVGKGKVGNHHSDSEASTQANTSPEPSAGGNSNK